MSSCHRSTTQTHTGTSTAKCMIKVLIITVGFCTQSIFKRLPLNGRPTAGHVVFDPAVLCSLSAGCTQGELTQPSSPSQFLSLMKCDLLWMVMTSFRGFSPTSPLTTSRYLRGSRSHRRTGCLDSPVITFYSAWSGEPSHDEYCDSLLLCNVPLGLWFI